ncbi:MAG: hypothetical protein OK454_11965 [Thaumarchaeota archaeon]|nr:hypothetical protein [Nitrososphaerota archaeon]
MFDSVALHSQLISPLVDIDAGFETQEALDITIAVFALILLALSLSAYRKTRMRRLLLVSGAFGLFAVEVLIRQLDDFVFNVGFQTEQIVVAAMEFVILLLFFLAIVVRD